MEFSVVLGFALSFAVVAPAEKSRLSKSSLFCAFHTHKGVCLSTDPGIVALFKVSISIALFFLLLSLLLLRVETTGSIRNKLHTGLWPLKILLCGLLFALALILPVEAANVWIYVSLVATLLVILIQTISILDATNQVLNCLRKTHDITSSKRVFFGCSSAAVLLYTTTLTAFFCFYVYFAQFSGCKTNRIFICINLGLCVTACMISLHPVVQDGGLVQSAIITSFCMYCTWSALYNNPRQECNPLANEILETDIKPTKSFLFAVDIAAFVATCAYVTMYIDRIDSFLGRFTLVCWQFKYFRSEQIQQEFTCPPRLSFQKALLGCKLSPKITSSPHNRPTTQAEIQKQEIPTKSNDKHELSQPENVQYNYSLFHLIYALFMLYFSILLITWVNERPGSHIKVNVHWAIMCIRMIASSCSVLLYTWSLVAHLLLFSFRQ